MANSRGFIVGIVIGAAITAGLFLLMQYLIESNNAPLPEHRADMEIDVTRDSEPPELKPRPTDPVRPIDENEPPPVQPPKPTTRKPSNGPVVPRGTPPVDPPTGPEIDIDTEPRPIYRVEPDYPLSELRREREGDVTVEFTITEDGKVIDIRVIEATSPAFARSATRAVAQWKYAPKVINGQKVAQRGVRVTLEFRIGEDD